MIWRYILIYDALKPRETFYPPTSEDKKAYCIDAQGAGRETEASLPWGVVTRNYVGIREYVVYAEFASKRCRERRDQSLSESKKCREQYLARKYAEGLVKKDKCQCLFMWDYKAAKEFRKVASGPYSRPQRVTLRLLSHLAPGSNK